MSKGDVIATRPNYEPLLNLRSPERRKAMFKLFAAFFTVTTSLLLPFFEAGAQPRQSTRESRAEAIQVLENSATMHYHQNYFVTNVSGIVGKDVPEIIRHGDLVTVNGNAVRANIIIVTEYLETMRWGGRTIANAGDVKCLVVEKTEDIPRDDNRSRLWINVLNCRVLRPLH